MGIRNTTCTTRTGRHESARLVRVGIPPGCTMYGCTLRIVQLPYEYIALKLVTAAVSTRQPPRRVLVWGLYSYSYGRVLVRVPVSLPAGTRASTSTRTRIMKQLLLLGTRTRVTVQYEKRLLSTRESRYGTSPATSSDYFDDERAK
eukprot:scaffold399446_cov18-Prasinocladus_malaysianus.AAC.1